MPWVRPIEVEYWELPIKSVPKFDSIKVQRPRVIRCVSAVAIHSRRLAFDNVIRVYQSSTGED